MDVHTITGITPADYKEIQAAAGKAGFTITGLKGGPVDHMSCKVWWEYQWHTGQASGNLVISIDAPPFMGGIAYRIIKDAIDSAIHPSPVPGSVVLP